MFWKPSIAPVCQASRSALCTVRIMSRKWNYQSLRVGFAALLFAGGAQGFSTTATYTSVSGSCVTGLVQSKTRQYCPARSQHASYRSSIHDPEEPLDQHAPQRDSKLLLASPAMAADAALDGTGAQPPAGASQNKSALMRYTGAFYDFSRPHTMRGTILASVTGVAKALLDSPSSVSLRLIPRALLGMVSLLLGNIYIVGINQIFDVDIDKINKPELPIAAGAISKGKAWSLVIACLTAGPYIVKRCFGQFIFRLYLTGLLVGTLYSVPPFQFKRFAVPAGLTIAFVRGVLLNVGVYYAVREALGFPFKWNPTVVFLARFMTVFAGIIAVTKDLPDVKGDREYNISTFASRRGVKFTARAACLVLALNYVSAIVQGAISPVGAFNKKVMVGGHSLLLVGLGIALRRLEPDSQESIKGFYKRIWDLFYLEYAIYPFI